jgi:molybdopterin molybdotransferase
MITHNECLNILRDLSLNKIIQTEQILIEESVGRLLEEDLIATESSPPFDNSAMDGFALNLSLLEKYKVGSLYCLPISNCIGAGDKVSITSGTVAVEIMTGAPLPSSELTAVIKIEDVVVSKNLSDQIIQIEFSQPPQWGENIRRSGEDFKEGQLILKKGTLLNHQHILALATLGIDKLIVRKKIKIAIASTGKELVDFKTKKLGPGMIRNSTGVYLESYLQSLHCHVQNLGIIADSIPDYQKMVISAFDNDCDMLISTGAVSMGKFDFVRPALEELGAKIHFHKCAIRPGKPILFATILYKQRTKYIFGIPGNAVSTAVGLRFFVVPFLNFLINPDYSPNLTSSKVRLKEETKKPEGLKCFFKADLEKNKDGQKTILSLPGQASFMVSPLLKTNSWVVFKEEGSVVPKGTEVEVFDL